MTKNRSLDVCGPILVRRSIAAAALLLLATLTVAEEASAIENLGAVHTSSEAPIWGCRPRPDVIEGDWMAFWQWESFDGDDVNGDGDLDDWIPGVRDTDDRVFHLVDVQRLDALVPRFRRGDGNADGIMDIADPVYVLNHLFRGTRAPSCLQTADANDDNVVDIADPVYQLNHLFGGGPALIPAVGECGADPTPAANAGDDLSCEAYPACGKRAAVAHQ